MGVSRYLLIGLALACATPATAVEREGCLSQDAIHVVKAKIGGDVVNARLCKQDRGLVYMLTVLAKSGKVTQARIDATDGHWLDGS